MSQEPEEDLIEELEDIEEEEIPFRYSITSYGADYTAEILVNKLNSEDILIPTFQRNFVWQQKQASKFIESLLLGLPIPGIFLSKELETGKHLVIDGLQRLRTLQSFYSGIFPKTEKVFKLNDVQKEFEGKTYKALSDKDRRQIDNSIIHATVVRQDLPSNDNSSVYLIFERLNTGGTQLVPQEIRACVYHGTFNELLNQLNENPNWRKIFGPKNPRMRDQELILRFLALNELGNSYRSPMKGFLNNFMGANKTIGEEKKKEFTNLFINSINFVEKTIGNKAFRRGAAINAAIFDSVLVGISNRLKNGEIANTDGIKTAYENLLGNENFVNSTETGTSKEEKVKLRLQLALNAFLPIK